MTGYTVDYIYMGLISVIYRTRGDNANCYTTHALPIGRCKLVKVLVYVSDCVHLDSIMSYYTCG